MSDKNLFLGDSEYPHVQSKIEAMFPDSAQRNHVQALINRIEQLERELAAIQQHAERYLWLRNSDNQIHEDSPCVCDDSFNTFFGNDLDAVIDAAISEVKK